MHNAEIKIGVLAFQGGFSSHIHCLDRLGIPSIGVKTTHDLENCSGLIIPGGESTTINIHLNQKNFKDALLKFSEKKPLFGTCAGLIIMAQLNILPLKILRNAYGRQSSSFCTSLNVKFPSFAKECEAIFIRAPQILEVKETSILASFEKQAVFVQHKNHLGTTFHPELTSDLTIHSYFGDICHHLMNKPLA